MMEKPEIPCLQVLYSIVCSISSVLFEPFSFSTSPKLVQARLQTTIIYIPGLAFKSLCHPSLCQAWERSKTQALFMHAVLDIRSDKVEGSRLCVGLAIAKSEWRSIISGWNLHWPAQFYLIVLIFISILRKSSVLDQQNSALAIVLTATPNSKKSNFENTTYHYTPSLCATSHEFAAQARQSRGYYPR